LLLAASVIFTGCDSDDPTPEYIVVDNPDLLEQNVYADENADESGVQIHTLAPWIAEITTSTTARNAENWGISHLDLTISDENAKWFMLGGDMDATITAFDNTGNLIGYFVFICR
jgi:hypothetical protein